MLFIVPMEQRQFFPPDEPRAPVLATVILGALAFFSFVPALLVSVMMFDAPGSENNKYLFVAAIGTFGFPVLCVVAAVLAWIGHWLRKPRFAARIVFLPLLAIAVAVVGYTLVGVLCHGATRC